MELKQLLDPGYEVKLPVFAGPLDLLLYLVEKNELSPKDISIADITDQYLVHLETLDQHNLAEAGEFLVMAARLMRLKARELLPADQKDELEDMEYLLDRQALIAQMMEYQKFKEAARALRNVEGKHFGAFPRGRPEAVAGKEAALGDEEAGVYDLLAAFRTVLTQNPRIPVHEVEIDDVTIEDRIQHVETEISRVGRCLFEDLFESDPRRMVKVVTFMAMLELCKLDRLVVRQNRSSGVIWVYPKQVESPHAQELEWLAAEVPEAAELEFPPGLVEWVQDQIRKRASRTSLEQILADLEKELRAEGSETPAGSDLESLAAASMDSNGPAENSVRSEEEEDA